MLHKLVGDPALRGAALRGLAGLRRSEDARRRSSALYPSLDRRREARRPRTRSPSAPAYAKALLDAVAAKKVPAARRVGRHRPPAAQPRRRGRSTSSIAEVWGIVRDTPAERAEADRRVRSEARRAADAAADLALGRAVFAKTCQQCHTLFGVGGKVGPDITGSNRANLDYLLENILDPQRRHPEGVRRARSLDLTDGRVVTGIVKERDADGAHGA